MQFFSLLVFTYFVQNKTIFMQNRAAPVGAALRFYVLLICGVGKLCYQLLQNGNAGVHVLCGDML